MTNGMITGWTNEVAVGVVLSRDIVGIRATPCIQYTVDNNAWVVRSWPPVSRSIRFGTTSASACYHHAEAARRPVGAGIPRKFSSDCGTFVKDGLWGSRFAKCAIS
jgi:hypothetical protein